MIIYVCQKGCVHEGGNSFAASTSLVAAWKELRKKRDEYLGWAERCSIKDVLRLKGWMYWEYGSDYFVIQKFDDLKDAE